MQKVFGLTIVLLLSAASLFAQEKTIDKAEFDLVMRNGYLKYTNLAFRQKTSFEDISNGAEKPRSTSKSVMEIMPTPVTRTVYEFDSPTLKQRRESIIADGKRYTREGDGPWTVEDFAIKPLDENRPEGVFEILDEKTEYRSLGSQVLDDQNVTVYAKIETKTMIHKTNRNETLSISTNKVFFGEDGGIVKQENLLENRIKSARQPAASVYRHRRTTVWEIDPNIRIVIPEVAAKF